MSPAAAPGPMSPQPDQGSAQPQAGPNNAATGPDGAVPEGSPPAAGAAASDAPGTGDTPPSEPESYSVGSGDEASAATSRHGQGSLRNEYLHEAERRFIEGDSVGRDKIFGDWVGGNQNIFNLGGEQRAALNLLSTRLLIEPIQEAFIAPEEFESVKARFEKARITILRGPAGCGKQGMGIRLLLDLCAGSLFQLGSVRDITQLGQWLEAGRSGRNRIDRGAGFLLNQPSDFADLTNSALQQLDETLTQADARLVVAVHSTVPVPDDDLFDYISEITSVADYSSILASHLRYRLGSQRAGRLLARTDIQDLIAEDLTSDLSYKKAADLAQVLADAAGSSNSEEFHVENVKLERLRHSTVELDTWFDGLDGIRSRSFAIALAVLDGLPYDTVAKGARALYRRVIESRQDEQAEVEQPFSSSRNEWLDRMNARVRHVEVSGAYGRSYAEIAEYRNPDYAPKVIRRAWSDYETQPMLLDWLGALAEDGSEQVRIRAGMELGRLATWSFEYLSANIFAPWAGGSRQLQHDAVAYALRVVAADPLLRENALTMISGWYSDRNRPTAQATAARAYGVAYGPLDPDASFAALERLSVVDDIRVVIAIGDSVADLLAAGTDNFARQALPRLAGSLGDLKRSAALQLIFLIAADALVSQVQAEDAADQVAQWPFLLRLTASLAEVRGAIVTLWRHVLNDALFYSEAEQVMSRWASAAESEPQIREAFLRLARAIVRGDERAHMILNRYAAKWSSADNLRPLPVVSAALQAVLAAEREG
jgi:hypothetical protein